MNQQMLYFAYGSNLKHQQMESRCPGSKYIKNYYLRDYELCFCWNGTGRSDGVANIIENSGSYVPGALWEISKKNKRKLDKCEGFNLNPKVYNSDKFELDGKEVIFYILNSNKCEKRDPTDKYVNTITQGYKDCNLEMEYLTKILRKQNYNIKSF